MDDERWTICLRTRGCGVDVFLGRLVVDLLWSLLLRLSSRFAVGSFRVVITLRPFSLPTTRRFVAF